ncbi:serine/threonine-protein kinase [Nocardioides cavernaquae]|uniref:Protein kinase domain-containing protein n=1 Tax=Nocardioides cavernaquae TaxID=2321396 RepID=A0A3A5H5S1_9ACTN|nr:protein kinase [Nocardioides cavernaquae]RJS45208.1 hypothetical protein D4739_02510 [Nocardioides cavernaquae]
MARGSDLKAWLDQQAAAGRVLSGRRVRLAGDGFQVTGEPVTVSIEGRTSVGGQAAVIAGRLDGYGAPARRVAIRVELDHPDAHGRYRRRSMLRVAEATGQDPVITRGMVNVYVTFQVRAVQHEIYGNGSDRPVDLIVDVMEWGRPLADVLAEKPPRAPESAVNWMLPLLRAFDRVHRQHRLIHRDIDPGNMLVDERGLLKATDWGIASEVDGTSVVTDPWGKAGRVYMAPETRDRENVGPFTDAWALGCLLCLVAAGEEPSLDPTSRRVRFPSKVARLPEPVRDVIQGLVVPDRHQRMTLETAIATLTTWRDREQDRRRAVEQRRADEKRREEQRKRKQQQGGSGTRRPTPNRPTPKQSPPGRWDTMINRISLGTAIVLGAAAIGAAVLVGQDVVDLTAGPEAPPRVQKLLGTSAAKGTGGTGGDDDAVTDEEAASLLADLTPRETTDITSEVTASTVRMRWIGTQLVASVRVSAIGKLPADDRIGWSCDSTAIGKKELMPPGIYLVVKGPYAKVLDDADQGVAWSFGSDNYVDGKWLLRPVACAVWKGDRRRTLLSPRKRWLDVDQKGWKASSSSPPFKLRYVLPAGGLVPGDLAPYPRPIVGLLVVTTDRKVIRQTFPQR